MPELKRAVPSLSLESNLEWLISPVCRESFFRQHWEKQPLVVNRRNPDYFESLLSLDEVDRALTTLDLRYPNVALKDAKRNLSAAEYVVRGDALDIASVYRLFNEGATIALSFLDAVIPSLGSLCRSLESEFSLPLQSNVYLTPPGAQGARVHFDTHDVFVLQVVGSKSWKTYGTALELPLRTQEFDPLRHQQGAPTLEFELEAGDLAYIPRGVMHDARSSQDVSLHITVGILAYTWSDLLLELVAEASLSDPAFRQALPPGFANQRFDRAEAHVTLDRLLSKLQTTSNLDSVLGRFAGDLISRCPPPLRGQMAQLANLDRLRIDSSVGKRGGVIARIGTEPESIVVECYGRTITFPNKVAEAVRFALSHSEFAVCDLPGGLDDAGKLTLIRRLVREGLVVVLSTD